MSKPLLILVSRAPASGKTTLAERLSADLDAALASGRFRPLDLPIPTLTIDTTQGYAPSLIEIRAMLESVR